MDSINNALSRYCTTAKGCYIVDLKDLVRRINSGEQMHVQKTNRTYSMDELRPDGLHVSEAGSTLLFEQMRETFESDPPRRCAGK